jgi:hypothetical protein
MRRATRRLLALTVVLLLPALAAPARAETAARRFTAYERALARDASRLAVARARARAHGGVQAPAAPAAPAAAARVLTARQISRDTLPP